MINLLAVMILAVSTQANGTNCQFSPGMFPPPAVDECEQESFDTDFLACLEEFRRSYSQSMANIASEVCRSRRRASDQYEAAMAACLANYNQCMDGDTPTATCEAERANCEKDAKTDLAKAMDAIDRDAIDRDLATLSRLVGGVQMCCEWY